MKTLSLMYSGFSIIEFPLPSPNPCALILCLSIHLLNLFFSLPIIVTLTCPKLNSCPPSTLAPEVLLPRALPQSLTDHMGLLIHLAIALLSFLSPQAPPTPTLDLLNALRVAT